MSELTPMSVAKQLADLSKELDALVKKTGEDDKIATVQKEMYIRAYATAWKATTGTAEARKQTALTLTQDERMAAETAASEVRDDRLRIDALKLRIEVGRSLGSTVRAEAALLNTPFSPYGS